jgi:signal transduction histidine kinase
MLSALRRSGVRAWLAVAALALVVLASALLAAETIVQAVGDGTVGEQVVELAQRAASGVAVERVLVTRERALALVVIALFTLLMTRLNLEHRRRRRAEVEARRHLAAVAHMDRRAALGELTASLTHELSQPLSAILRNAEAAEMLLASDPQHDPRLDEIIADIRRCDQRAHELIRRMRNLLRRQDLESKPVDLNDVARDTVDLVKPDADAKGIDIVLDTAKRASVVIGDRVHLEQVVLNLMLNGMEAMADVPARRRRLIVRTIHSNGHAGVLVEDSGPGIPADALPHIFEPFFTTKEDGMGMGLSIARSVIDAHGGRIVAENNDGSGATIGFSLPLPLRDQGTTS